METVHGTGTGNRYPASKIEEKIKMVRQLLAVNIGKKLDSTQIELLMEKGASVLTCLVAGFNIESLSSLGYCYQHAEVEMNEPDFTKRLEIGMKYHNDLIAKKLDEAQANDQTTNIDPLPFRNIEMYKELVLQLPRLDVKKKK